MRRRERKAIRMGAMLFLVGVLVFAGVMVRNGFNMNRFAREASYNRVTYRPEENFDSVDVSDVDADVRILPATDGACSVVCDETSRRSCIVEVEGGALTVRREKKWYDYIVNINLVPQELTVYLPNEAYARMQVKSVSGDVRIEGVGAEEIGLRTVSGGIDLEGVALGALDAKTTSGAVRMRDSVAAGNVRIQTVSGAIDLEGVELGALDADITSGAVRMRDSIATGAVRIQTVSGGIRLDGSDASDFDLKTVSGSIKGELMSGKVFSVHSVSGAVDVPESEADQGRFSASTTSGGVKILVRNP